MNKEYLLNRIKTSQANIAIIGLGYIGLPLVAVFSKVGFNVLGFDIDENKVDRLNRGESYITDVSGEAITSLIENKKFHAPSDFSELILADAILICVSTPLNSDREPDLSFVINTTKTIANFLRKGQLVVLESTTYPGTTEEEALPILKSSKLRGREGFFLGLLL